MSAIGMLLAAAHIDLAHETIEEPDILPSARHIQQAWLVLKDMKHNNHAHELAHDLGRFVVHQWIPHAIAKLPSIAHPDHAEWIRGLSGLIENSLRWFRDQDPCGCDAEVSELLRLSGELRQSALQHSS